jgi:hypothetical protein
MKYWNGPLFRPTGAGLAQREPVFLWRQVIGYFLASGASLFPRGSK